MADPRDELDDHFATARLRMREATADRPVPLARVHTTARRQSRRRATTAALASVAVVLLAVLLTRPGGQSSLVTEPGAPLPTVAPVSVGSSLPLDGTTTTKSIDDATTTTGPSSTSVSRSDQPRTTLGPSTADGGRRSTTTQRGSGTPAGGPTTTVSGSGAAPPAPAGACRSLAAAEQPEVGGDVIAMWWVVTNDGGERCSVRASADVYGTPTGGTWGLLGSWQAVGAPALDPGQSANVRLVVSRWSEDVPSACSSLQADTATEVTVRTDRVTVADQRSLAPMPVCLRDTPRFEVLLR